MTVRSEIAKSTFRACCFADIAGNFDDKTVEDFMKKHPKRDLGDIDEDYDSDEDAIVDFLNFASPDKNWLLLLDQEAIDIDRRDGKIWLLVEFE